jgi:hypothetical protein
MKDGRLDMRCSMQRGKNFSDSIKENEVKMEHTVFKGVQY